MSELIDNRVRRIATLKQVIRQLHQEGQAAVPRVKTQLRELVRQTDGTEIAAMEQQLIAEGMSVDEVRSMCDLHAEVLREIMIEPKPVALPPGHPVDTFRRENEALRNTAQEMRSAIEQIRSRPEGAQLADALTRWRKASSDLVHVDQHYARKENLLFSRLERHGIVGPSKVMWAKDDEARQLLKRVQRILARESLSVDELIELADTTADPALEAVEGMIFKEENILLPMSLETLSEEDWGEIWRDSPQYGWCLVEPREGYRPPQLAEESSAAEATTWKSPGGNLSFEQLQGIFAALPVDLTFVDADDRVAFFSEGPSRVFQRSRAILGRKVQNCHPPASVHVVEKILADFRGGQEDVAEFWINFRGKFVHIRYFAVRDQQRRYLGTLEVTQDLTPLRSLEGERRLLEFAGPRAQ